MFADRLTRSAKTIRDLSYMQMESNDAISQKIWNGSIPVSFCISPSEMPHELSATPPPFLMLVPRVTYFPLVLEKTILQFCTYLQSKFSLSRTHSRSDLTDDSSPAHSTGESRPTKKDLEYWLSYDGIPLKWQVSLGYGYILGRENESYRLKRRSVPTQINKILVYIPKWSFFRHYPVGLLFDLYGSSDKLPWEITVHFGDYPADILLAPPVSRSAVEAIFLATLKEADQLKHRGREGPGPIFDGLLPEEQHRLWNGLTQHRFDLFWSINKRFMQGAPAPVRSLPPPGYITNFQGFCGSRPASFALEPKRGVLASLALFIDTAANPAEGDVEDGQTTRIHGEEAAALMVATGAMKAFRHCPFRVYFSPHAFETSSPTMTYLQALVSPFIGVDGIPATFSDVIATLLKCGHVQLHAEDFTFLVHGVEVPLETPAQWMCEWMAYPDNFVHVVACKRKE
ncbi:unnamed protein product [Taenia asiatica]|uniref:Autophagy protein 5 n=1 Tax=Taenia asiatica TaxID=60517 RepID=A0A0R3VT55_TAEAS|nr:unnamed protein product [Taenia asiatica]